MGSFCSSTISCIRSVSRLNGESTTSPAMLGSRRLYSSAVTAPIERPHSPTVDTRCALRKCSTTTCSKERRKMGGGEGGFGAACHAMRMLMFLRAGPLLAMRVCTATALADARHSSRCAQGRRCAAAPQRQATQVAFRSCHSHDCREVPGPSSPNPKFQTLDPKP
eukprot:41760-Chlamydomonas_euryale.AAC.1